MNILYPPFATDCEGAISLSDYSRDERPNQPLHIVVRDYFQKDYLTFDYCRYITYR